MTEIELGNNKGMPMNISSMPMIPMHNEQIYKNICSIIIAVGLNRPDVNFVIDRIYEGTHDVLMHKVDTSTHYMVKYEHCVFEENKLVYFEDLSEKIVYLRSLKIKNLKK